MKKNETMANLSALDAAENEDKRRHRPEKARHDYQTPEHILELAREVFNGPIQLDAFTSPSNPTSAARFCSPAPPPPAYAGGWSGPDGMSITWAGHARWFNPPYGRFLSGFAEKWYETWLTDHMDDSSRIALVPARTDTVWWERMCLGSSAVCLWSSRTLGSRIQFIDPTTGQPKKSWSKRLGKEVRGGNDSASSFFYYGTDPARFGRVFYKHGRVFFPWNQR